jgi:2-oxoglutarate ferredoxin oxidoreductase subunit beta
MRLAALTFPNYPVPLGVYYQKSRDLFTLKEDVDKTVDDLPGLFRSKASWQQS